LQLLKAYWWRLSTYKTNNSNTSPSLLMHKFLYMYATEKTNYEIIIQNATYSVKWKANNGSSNPSSSTSNKPFKIGSFLIPRKPQQLLSISIVGTKINRFEWSCSQNIYKVPFPKSSQPLRSGNFADKLEYIPLLTTNYVFQLQSFKWSNTSSYKTKQKEKINVTTILIIMQRFFLFFLFIRKIITVT